MGATPDFAIALFKREKLQEKKSLPINTRLENDRGREKKQSQDAF
jgi:hypothetical protein